MAIVTLISPLWAVLSSVDGTDGRGVVKSGIAHTYLAFRAAAQEVGVGAPGMGVGTPGGGNGTKSESWDRAHCNSQMDALIRS